MADVLTIEPDEAVEQVRARLARARSREVYLYLPRPNVMLRRRLSLALLRRTADELGLNVTLVTRDSATRVMASTVGLPVRRRMERRKWKGKGGRGRMEGREWTGSVFRFPFSISHSPFSSLALAVGLLVLGLALTVLVVPHATVVVTPLTASLETTVDVRVDPGLVAVDVSGRRIPARRLEVTLERQAQEPTSAHREVPDAQARGTVMFINQGEDAVQIPAGAIVRKADGSTVAFRTLEAVTLPGPAGTTARVPVEAVAPGVAGNLPAYTLDLLDPTLGLPVAVANDQPMSGGSMREVSMVTEEDRNRVRDRLLDRTRQEAVQALRAQVRDGESLIDASVETQVLDETFSEPVGAVADVVAVDLTVRAVATAIAFDHLRQVAEEVVRQEVPAGQLLVDSSLVTEIGPLLRNEGSVASVQVRATARTQARISESDIKYVVRGRPVDEAARVLRERFPLAATPVIDVSPRWFGRMPWLSMRMDVATQNSSGVVDED